MKQINLNSSKMVALGITLAMSTTLALSGCTKMSTSEGQVGKSEVRGESSAQEESNGTSRNPNVSESAHHAVNSIYTSSETIYENLKAQEWDKASEQLTTLNTDRKTLKSSSLGKGSDQYVEKISHDLGQKIAKKDQFAAMEDANQLTRAAMDLGEPVPAKLTKELTLLDFYGREIEIGALSKDKNKISAATRDIKQVWKSLKPAIEAKSPNTEEPAKFEHVVKQLEEAKDFGTYKDLSTSFLTQVDSLESASGGAGSQAQNP